MGATSPPASPVRVSCPVIPGWTGWHGPDSEVVRPGSPDRVNALSVPHVRPPTPRGAHAYSCGVALAKSHGKRALDRILEGDFVDGLESMPLAELRNRRLQVDREEAWLSYLRRMLHGRIDILEANVSMRRDGHSSDEELDLGALVASLATQMGPGTRASGPDVVDSPGGGRRAVERLIARSGLDEYATMTDVELDNRLDELRDMEREVSDVRHRVHDVHSVLTEELARRYRVGEARPESALGKDS